MLLLLLSYYMYVCMYVCKEHIDSVYMKLVECNLKLHTVGTIVNIDLQIIFPI